MMAEKITSRQNPLLVHLRKLLASRSYREKSGQFVGDGVKLLQEAVQWNAGLQTVIMTEGAVHFSLPEDVRVVEVPKDVMASISMMEAPQGALFICAQPPKRELEIDGRCLILDCIQDPGNVGTILRTADAMDIPVVLSDGCADPYNPKTVRASMGAVFRSPPQIEDRDTIIRFCRKSRIPIYSTALSERAVDLRQLSLDGAVVIGSEGHGVCDEYLAASEREIIIPMSTRCESLNAATAATIVLWEMRNR